MAENRIKQQKSMSLSLTSETAVDQFELIDYEQIKAAFEKRFDKKCEILFRAHIYGKEKLSNVIDLTQYPDMQELLYTSDALITDYVI